MPVYEWGGDLVRYIVPTTWTNTTVTLSDHRWTSNTTSATSDWHVLTYNGSALTYGGGGGGAGNGTARTRFLREEQAARSVARTAARDRAVALLESMLGPEQVTHYRLHGTFEIIGSHGTLYRVCRGVSGNIEWIKPDGSVGGRLCAHPDMFGGWMPEADVHLSQLLALRTDERAFCRVANVHQGQRPPVVAA